MARVMVEGCALPLVRRYGKSEWLAAKQESILTQRAQRKLKPQSSRSFTVKSGSKATLPRGVMAGAGPPPTTTLLATRKVVDGRPAPAMTRIATVALLADC